MKMTSCREETGGTITMERSMRTIPPTYAPSLLFCHGKKFRDQTFCTLFDDDYHVRSVPEMRGMRCVSSSHGWLLLQSNFTPKCHLFNPVTLKKINLPPLISNAFNVGSLTSSPSDPNCFVAFYSERRKSLVYCRVGGENWIQQNLGRRDRGGLYIQGHCDVVSCRGKIYLDFFRGMVALDFHDSFASVKIFERKLDYLDFSLPDDRWILGFFVESCGEIFKVIAIHWGSLHNIIQKFDVFKLDFSTMGWIRVDSIGDQIFLLGRSSTSFSTAKTEAKGNCIYYTLPGYTTLYVFDMDNGTITSSSCPNTFPNWIGPCWVVPTCNLQVKKSAKNSVQSSIGGNNYESRWNDLPIELLELIVPSLFLGDCVRFRLTSKRWIPLTPPPRSDRLLMQANLGSCKLPWLMSIANMNEGVCTLSHPIYGDTYTINIPEIAGAVIRESKHGWLLMSRGDTSIFFFNPLTIQTIHLPELYSKYELTCISFSAPPTSIDCIIFGYETSHAYFGTMIVYWMSLHESNTEYSKDAWYPLYRNYKVAYTFMPAFCNPIFCDGFFYCLSLDGKLRVLNTKKPDEFGVLNPEEPEEQLEWQVLPVPPIFSYKEYKDFKTPIRSFILEHDGDIFSVFVYFTGKPIRIFKLDRSQENMKWVKTEYLGEKVIYHSDTASILVPSGLKGVENRIYFSRFHDKETIFYSLSTGSYHCFNCKSFGGNCKNICEPSHCTWIQFTN